MGYVTQADHAFPIDTLVTLLDYIRKDAKECRGKLEVNKLWKLSAFICLVTLASLGGYEGFHMDLAGLRSHLNKSRHGVIPTELTHKSVL